MAAHLAALQYDHLESIPGDCNANQFMPAVNDITAMVVNGFPGYNLAILANIIKTCSVSLQAALDNRGGMK